MTQFYALSFLSQTELQQTLSSRNVQQLNQYIPKIFEQEELIESGNNVISFISNKGKKDEEVVTLKTPVSNILLTQANISEFLQLYENEVKSTLKKLMREAQTDLKFAEFPFDSVSKYPCQVVMSHFQVYWHSQISKAVDSNNIEPIYASIEKQISQISQIVKSNIKDTTVLNCLTILISFAELIEKRLTGQLDHESLKIQWNSWVKFEWTDDLYAFNNEGKTPYGYEYVGKRPVLVRTDLTEKVCTGTLNSKSKFIYSSGPAGTGKTETFKDYFYYIGKQSVVINCSDQMTQQTFNQLLDFEVLSKRVQIYDEFNRLNFEQSDHFLSLLQNQSLQSSYVCFTFNPNYQGRHQLPEKFYQVSQLISEMTVPDQRIITRVHFAHQGISLSKDLAKKFIEWSTDREKNFQKLTQIDFGLRFILNSIRTTGKINQQINDESFSLALAIKQHYIHRLPKKFQQSEIFQISYKFLGYNPEKKSQLEYYSLIPYANVVKSPFSRVYEAVQLRHGVGMLSENPLEIAESFASDTKNIEVYDIKTVILPLNETIFQIKGPLENAMIEGSQNLERQFYIILVGEFYAELIENLNTLLDDNKVFCNKNGERFPLTSNMRIVLSGQNCDKASPAFVSRVSFIQF